MYIYAFLSLIFPPGIEVSKNVTFFPRKFMSDGVDGVVLN
jgi:hypothetical protein